MVTTSLFRQLLWQVFLLPPPSGIWRAARHLASWRDMSKFFLSPNVVWMYLPHRTSRLAASSHSSRVVGHLSFDRILLTIHFFKPCLNFSMTPKSDRR